MGLSILPGSPTPRLVPEVLRRHHPGRRRRRCCGREGVAAVITPRDFGITDVIGRIPDEIRTAHTLDPLEVPS